MLLQLYFTLAGTAASSTIRSKSCYQVVENAGKACQACLTVRRNVMKRNKPAATSIHASTPRSKVKDSSVLAAEVVHLRRGQRELRAELERVKKSIEEGCVEVNSDLHTDLQQFYKSVGDKIDPFVQLFWEEQKALKLENRGVRWHPMLIKFAIFIRQQSLSLDAGHGNPETPRRVNAA